MKRPRKKKKEKVGEEKKNNVAISNIKSGVKMSR